MLFLFLSLLRLTLSSRVGLEADESYYVPTRDGAYLKTYFWYPDDRKFAKPWPCVYEKTPYDAALDGGTGRTFNDQGYAYMSQDVRGKYGSNGTYSFFRTSGNDSIDTIEWFNANTQSWSTGQLSFHGVSADCLGQYASLTGVTQSGYWPNGNGVGHQTVYQGGAYREGLINRWLAAIGEESSTIAIKDNENFGPYWYTLDGQYENQWNILDQPLLNFAGFYDIFGQNQIITVNIVNVTSVSAGQQILFVDPGGHCPSGDIFWPEGEEGWDYLNNEVGPAVFKAIFEANSKNEKFDIHKVLDFNVMFYMLGPGGSGEQGNFWVQALSFPPITQVQLWYFGDCSGMNCTLSTTQGTTDKSITYTYDPNDPMHTWGGNNLMIQPCGPENQNVPEDGRTDVIHFDSEAFTTLWGIVGNLTVNLYVSSDSVDTDFVAKIIDVYPDGKANLIQDSIIRMRWRNGPYATEQAPDMTSGTVYNVLIELGYMSWIFNPGHKLRVTISSSNNPRFSVNWNTGNWVNKGSVGGHPAVNTIHYGSKYPSSLSVSIVDLDWVNSHRFNFSSIDKSNWWSKEQSRKARAKMYRVNDGFMNEYMKRWDKVDEMAQEYYKYN